MGIVTFSIPKELVIRLCKARKINNFIETGTYKGGTTFWASNHFDKVYTIEIDEEISKATASKVQVPSNIEFLIGNSKDILPDLLARVSGNCFFWLDGHWCSGAGGKEDECPLLFELEAIKATDDPIIFIDDARCFLGPLPAPHNSSHWPRIDDIFHVLHVNFPGNLTTIHDDVIISIPRDLKVVLDEDWKTNFNQRFHNKPKLGPIQKVIKKIGNILK